MNISFAKKALPKSGTLILTVQDKSGLGPAGKELDKATKGAIKRAMVAAGFNGGPGQSAEILAPSGVGLSRVVLIGLGAAGKVTNTGLERQAASAVGKILTRDKSAVLIVDLARKTKLDDGQVAARLGFGVLLGAYRFHQHKTKVKEAAKPKLTKVTIQTDALASARKNFAPLQALSDGVYLARDLVNEPGNVIYPKAFVSKCRKLSQDGLKVSVLSEKQMHELKMHSLLGVGQGSAKESQLLIMQWNGGKKSEAPIALVGKGVTFDSGGISLKPGGGMEDMKGDMGGAAAVAGTVAALAKRKAKVNVVGVIGLVENMPDADAQRPGDIVKSMSGQTIEIINTDAEGRLVLADALWYTQLKLKPKCMVDLATLTGAILVSLGQEHAGLFSNNDKMAKELKAAGEESGESVWRLPLGVGYDKMIDSQFADMKNTGGRYGGSITAAQFLQRFTNDLPWVHLDIAGTAWGPKSPVYPGWGTGYGVRLLNEWIASNYE